MDLVVVITSDAANQRLDALQLVGEAIVPAATGLAPISRSESDPDRRRRFAILAAAASRCWQRIRLRQTCWPPGGGR